MLAHLQAKREQEKKTEHIAEMLAKERERIRVSKGSAKRDGHRRKSNRGGQRSVGPISGSSSPHQPVMSHDR